MGVVGLSLRDQLREALAVIERLRVENDELRERVGRLEAELAARKADSSTSSKPPSSDLIGSRKKRAERRAEARGVKHKPGKQPGAPGANLARRDPDVRVEHKPSACEGCGASLADALLVGSQVRQVIDLPPVRPVITDHVVYRCRCACGTETIAEFPPEAKAPVCFGPEVRAVAVYLLTRQHLPVERTAELLSDLLGVHVSTGWLCAIQAEAAGRLTPFLAWLKDRLIEEPVVHADETGTTVGTVKHWVHTLTTNLLTLIAVHPRRGREAMEDIGLLGVYAGTIVHDGYASYDIFDSAIHAQCNAHILRYLKSVGETKAFTLWTTQMTGVLLDAKVASKAAAQAGQRAVPAEINSRIRKAYKDTLDVAFALLPDGKPPRRKRNGGWTEPQRKAWNLATRLRSDEDQFLRCLQDTAVPWDNNTAERALRMIKLHDKISGPFHSLTAAEAFATIRSYLQTANNHNQNLLNALHQLFTTSPWTPAPT